MLRGRGGRWFGYCRDGREGVRFCLDGRFILGRALLITVGVIFRVGVSIRIY